MKNLFSFFCSFILFGVKERWALIWIIPDSTHSFQFQSGITGFFSIREPKSFQFQSGITGFFSIREPKSCEIGSS